jgi:hypothetical protein
MLLFTNYRRWTSVYHGALQMSDDEARSASRVQRLIRRSGWSFMGNWDYRAFRVVTTVAGLALIVAGVGALVEGF